VLGDLVRQYSLCGDPTDPHRLTVAVLREPESRGGSAYVHEKLAVGSTVTVRGPRNHFPLVSAPRYLFIAGGIGITPLIPMIREAEATGADWHLYYRGRSRATMAYVDALAAYGDRVTLLPGDETGPLDLASVLAEPSDGTAIYVCGPERLLAGCEEICSASWPAGALHLERFAAKEIDAPEGGERSFELELAATGITLTVPPDRSVFHVIEDAGISVLGSCHEGICGTCEAIVLEGDVDHRDSVLNESERAANDAMMICVSRCRSDRLVLDL
jgi:ferredoxin-NADP reductase